MSHTSSKLKPTRKDKKQSSEAAPVPENTYGTIRLILTGFAMGSADLIPGVSGGTIAFIFGIYEKLLSSIQTVTGKTVQLFFRGKIQESVASIPWTFLVPLGGGILAAIVLLAKILSWLLQEYSSYIYGFFFGLVIASLVLVGRRIPRWKVLHGAAFVLSALLMYGIAGSVPVETAATLPLFFLSGMIAICAMILPGISGSFILLILGKYSQVLEAVTERNILVLVVFMGGCVVGVAIFSRLLKWLLSRYHDLMIAILTGIMLGSLRKLWPWQEVLLTRVDSHGETVPMLTRMVLPSSLDTSAIVVLVLMIAGIGAMWGMNRMLEKGARG